MEKILYVHIPKAGGSAVNNFFLERLGERNCYPHAENGLQDGNADLSRISESQFVSAHLLYPRLRKQFAGQQRFTITVMRTPMEQITSHLAWVRFQTDIRQTKAYLGLPDFLKQLAQRMTKIDLGNPVALEKFLASLDSRELAFFDNCQTRYLVPYVAGPLGPGMLVRAKRNLQALDFVGLVEGVQDMFDFLAWRFGLVPADGSKKVNASQQRYGLDPADPALREVLQPYVTMDEDLYALARRFFAASIYEFWSEIELESPGLIDRKRIQKHLSEGAREVASK